MSIAQPNHRNFVRKMSLADLLSSIFVIYIDNIFTILLIALIHFLTYLTGIPGLASIFISAIVLVCSRYALGRPIQLWDIYKNVLFSKYVLHLLIGTIVILFVIILPLGALMMAMGPFGLLLMPVQFLFLLFFASIVLIEKRGFLQAFGRLFSLLFSNFLRIFGYFYVCVLIFFGIPALILNFLGITVIQLLTDSQWIAIWVLYPFLYISVVLLYYDTRVRKENYSEELLAQEMGYEVSTEVLMA